jgi:hypothetical protein
MKLGLGSIAQWSLHLGILIPLSRPQYLFELLMAHGQMVFTASLLPVWSVLIG